MRQFSRRLMCTKYSRLSPEHKIKISIQKVQDGFELRYNDIIKIIGKEIVNLMLNTPSYKGSDFNAKQKAVKQGKLIRMNIPIDNLKEIL